MGVRPCVFIVRSVLVDGFSPGEGTPAPSSIPSGFFSSSLLDVSSQTSLPPQCSQFPDVFNAHGLSSLPPHWPGYDMKINFKPVSVPSYRGPYLLSSDETLELYAYIEVQLDKGNIFWSTSPAAAPIFFVKVPGKKD